MHALFLCLLLIFDSILSSLHPSYIFLPQAANKCLVRLESTAFGLGLVSQAGCLLGTASLCHALSESEMSGRVYGGPFVSFSFLPQGHHGGGQKEYRRKQECRGAAQKCGRGWTLSPSSMPLCTPKQKWEQQHSAFTASGMLITPLSHPSPAHWEGALSHSVPWDSEGVFQDMCLFLYLLTHDLLTEDRRVSYKVIAQADFLSFLLQLYSENLRSERENKNK